jgi:hypothetical protein
VERRLQQLVKEAGPMLAAFADDHGSDGDSDEAAGGSKADQLCDVEYYLQDILATLYSFLRVHPESAVLFGQHLDVALLARLYDQILPKLFRIVVPHAIRGSLLAFSFLFSFSFRLIHFNESRAAAVASAAGEGLLARAGLHDVAALLHRTPAPRNWYLPPRLHSTALEHFLK